MQTLMPPIYLNGRFLTQNLTGVQRFATEVVLAMDELAAPEGVPAMQILTPSTPGRAGGICPNYRHFSQRQIGRMHGQVWEQLELPFYTRGGVLVSLGNTGPVLSGRTQIVVIHDTGAFDTPDTYSTRVRVWYKALWRMLVQVGVRIVTVSEFSRERISKHLRIDPGEIHLVREGGDHMLRLPADTRILARHGLEAARFGLIVGSQVAHKNLQAMAETARLFQRRGMALAIAGGIDRAVFRSSESGFDAPVCMLGRVTDAELRALYEAATCLLFPTNYEGFGLPAVEAMVCNCPVLTSGAGAVKEICGDAALYFDTSRPESINAAVERLLDDADCAEMLRSRGKARIAIFNWPNAARDLAHIINHALNGQPS